MNQELTQLPRHAFTLYARCTEFHFKLTPTKPQSNIELRTAIAADSQDHFSLEVVVHRVRFIGDDVHHGVHRPGGGGRLHGQVKTLYPRQAVLQLVKSCCQSHLSTPLLCHQSPHAHTEGHQRGRSVLRESFTNRRTGKVSGPQAGKCSNSRSRIYNVRNVARS